jgi:hypothetical protein
MRWSISTRITYTMKTTESRLYAQPPEPRSAVRARHVAMIWVTFGTCVRCALPKHRSAVLARPVIGPGLNERHTRRSQPPAWGSDHPATGHAHEARRRRDAIEQPELRVPVEVDSLHNTSGRTCRSVPSQSSDATLLVRNMQTEQPERDRHACCM